MKIKDGFLQEPKTYLNYHLEDIITHTVTNTDYQIKEIQAKGLVVLVHKSLIPKLIGVKAYISKDLLHEYKGKI